MLALVDLAVLALFVVGPALLMVRSKDQIEFLRKKSLRD